MGIIMPENAPHIDKKDPVNIGTIYTTSTDPRYADEKNYGSILDGINPASKNLEKNLNAKFIVLDYHSAEVEAIIRESKTEKDALHKLKAYVRKFCAENNIHGLMAPGNDYNIISPGQNTDNNNRALMERALEKFIYQFP